MPCSCESMFPCEWDGPVCPFACHGCVQMSLYKGSMEIAKEYARLCKNRITERLVFDTVSEEYNITKSQVGGSLPCFSPGWASNPLQRS